MKNYKIANVLIGVILIFWGSAGVAWGKLNVVTTTQDLAAIAKEVGGDLIKVESIAKGHQDPHYLHAKPSYMVKLNRADLLAYQGMELEIGWLPLLIRGARNNKVLAGKPGHLDISNVIEPLEIPLGAVDRSMGDIHPFGNPHYPLNPENGILIAQVFAERLSQLDPPNEETYKNNAGNFKQRVTAKILQWKKRLQPFSKAKVVTYHSTWSYFLDYFDIESVGTVEDPPGVPPASRHLAKLAKVMRQTGASVILQAHYFETKFSELLSARTGARVVALPSSVGGDTRVATYIDLFDFLVIKLEEAFSETQSLSRQTKGSHD